MVLKQKWSYFPCYYLHDVQPFHTSLHLTLHFDYFSFFEHSSYVSRMKQSKSIEQSAGEGRKGVLNPLAAFASSASLLPHVPLLLSVRAWFCAFVY